MASRRCCSSPGGPAHEVVTAATAHDGRQPCRSAASNALIVTMPPDVPVRGWPMTRRQLDPDRSAGEASANWSTRRICRATAMSACCTCRSGRRPTSTPGATATFPMEVKYRWRSAAGPIIDVAPSRLDVGINGIYLDSELAGPGSSGARAGSAGSPRLRRHPKPYAHGRRAVSTTCSGFNDTAVLLRCPPACTAATAWRSRTTCACPSTRTRTLDLSPGLPVHRDAQPRLLRRTRAFPFSRDGGPVGRPPWCCPTGRARSRSAAFLNLMGRFGSLTGYPVLRVAVVRPGHGVNTVSGPRHACVMGTHAASREPPSDLLRNCGGPHQRQRGSQLALPSTFDTTVGRLFGDQTWMSSAQRRGRRGALRAGSQRQHRGAGRLRKPPVAAGARSSAMLAGSSRRCWTTMVATLRDSEQGAADPGRPGASVGRPGHILSGRRHVYGRAAAVLALAELGAARPAVRHRRPDAHRLRAARPCPLLGDAAALVGAAGAAAPCALTQVT